MLSISAIDERHRTPVLNSLKQHWPNYLAEAAGLMMFMIGAGAFTTLFMYPGSPVQQALASDLLRQIGLGIVMGFVTAGIIYSPWGQKSGAHINPAVTWSFFRLGKITRSDAVLYTVFQFLGAMLAPVLLLWAIGEPFTHEKVKYATTQPGPQGSLIAFAAEFVISFFLMLAVLVVMNSERFEKTVGALVGVLIAVYIAFESPLSGMSLNPARTFGSGLTAGQWKGLWLYFLAPVLSMLLATEVYLWMRRRGLIASVEEHRAGRSRCWICDYKEGPDFPVEQPKA
jgi:aquaporin Z